jgi:hypothetical protein
VPIQRIYRDSRAGAQRKDRCLSASATIKGAALSKVGVKLAKVGLVREIEAKPGAAIWRRDDAGQGYALKLTAAGLKAIEVYAGSQDTIEPSEASQPHAKNVASSDEGGHPARVVAAPRDGSKLALVIEHLLRADGATIIDLSNDTGWPPHTTRAALTGLRKRGYAVIRERTGVGGSVYRISDAARCFPSVDRRQPRGPRSRWVAPSMARPFSGEPPTYLSRWLLMNVLAYQSLSVRGR